MNVVSFQKKCKKRNPENKEKTKHEKCNYCTARTKEKKSMQRNGKNKKKKFLQIQMEDQVRKISRGESYGTIYAENNAD